MSKFKVQSGRPKSLSVFLFALTFSFASSGMAATWYIRPDGGTRYSANLTSGQCDGLADVAYSGSATKQHCAFNDVHYMWMDGTYGHWSYRADTRW